MATSITYIPPMNTNYVSGMNSSSHVPMHHFANTRPHNSTLIHPNSMTMQYYYTKYDMPIPEWISARYLLQSLNDNAIQKCMENIIKSIPAKDIILMLIQSSNNQQFKCIYGTLKSSLTHIENHRREKEKDRNNNYLDKLPSSTIYNICDFLDKSAMANLKLCSMSISLIIFEIMKCISVGIVNMNELISSDEYKSSMKLDICSKIKIKRIKPFTKYKSLMNSLQNEYDIPFEDMLVLKSDFLILNNSWHRNITQISKGIILNKTSQFESKVENHKVLFIFNTSKIINLSKNTPSDQYSLCLVQYYDRNEQNITNLKYILLDKSIINRNYLEDNIMKSLEENNNTEILNTIHKMKEFGGSSPVFTIYHHKETRYRTGNHFDPQGSFTTIYVSNIPHQSSIKDIKQIFEQVGTIANFKYGGNFALITYDKKNAAREALR